MALAVGTSYDARAYLATVDKTQPRRRQSSTRTASRLRHTCTRMAMLHWDTDDRTARAAAKYCPIHVDPPSSEFAGGKNFRTSSWEHRVVQASVWPKGSLFSSPDQIIGQFHDGHYTQGLAMVASW